jgi:hypothetical protein
VVVDDVMFRAVLHSRSAAQLDRRELMLKDPPAKKSLKQSHVPPMPISMFAEEPFDEDVATSKPTVHTVRSTWHVCAARTVTRHVINASHFNCTSCFAIN